MAKKKRGDKKPKKVTESDVIEDVEVEEANNEPTAFSDNNENEEPLVSPLPDIDELNYFHVDNENELAMDQPVTFHSTNGADEPPISEVANINDTPIFHQGGLTETINDSTSELAASDNTNGLREIESSQQPNLNDNLSTSQQVESFSNSNESNSQSDINTIKHDETNTSQALNTNDTANPKEVELFDSTEASNSQLATLVNTYESEESPISQDLNIDDKSTSNEMSLSDNNENSISRPSSLINPKRFDKLNASQVYNNDNTYEIKGFGINEPSSSKLSTTNNPNKLNESSVIHCSNTDNTSSPIDKSSTPSNNIGSNQLITLPSTNETTPLLPIHKRNSTHIRYDSTQSLLTESQPIPPLPVISKYLVYLRFAEVFILLFIVAVVTTPPFLAQICLNMSHIDLHTTSISQATNNSFRIQLQATLYTPFSAPGKTSSSNISILYDNQIMGYTTIPSIDISKTVTNLKIDDVFYIEDEKLLGKFSKRLITENGKVGWVAKGNVSVEILSWLKLKGLKMEMEMELKGMRGLKEIEILGIEMPSNHELGGIKILARSSLFNPTNNTLSVGTVDYGMFYKGLKLTLVQAEDLTIVPGMNRLDLIGRLLPQNHLEDLNIVSDFVEKFIRGETLEIEVKGLGVYPSVNWLDSAIRDHQVKLNYKNPDSTEFVSSIEILNLSTDFDKYQPYAPLTASDIKANIQSPFHFPYNVTKVKEQLRLSRNVIGRGKKMMATLDIPESDAITVIDDNKDVGVITKFENIPLRVGSNQISRNLFDNFLTDMVFLNEANCLVEGRIDTTVSTAIGPLTLNNLPIHLTMSFPGMSGMIDPPPELKSLTVISSKDGKVQFKARVAIANPTQFSGHLGQVKLQVNFEGVKVGIVIIDEFSLIRNGIKLLDANGSFDLPNCKEKGCLNSDETTKQRFLAGYINGEDMLVNSLGSLETTPIKSLQPALSKLNYTMSVPKVPDELLKSTLFKLFASGVQLTLSNPFPTVQIQINQISSLALHNQTPVAKIQLDFLSNDEKLNPTNLSPIILKGGQLTKTDTLPVELLNTGWDIIWPAIGGRLKLNVTVEVGVQINGFNTFIKFTKMDVQSKVTL